MSTFKEVGVDCYTILLGDEHHDVDALRRERGTTTQRKDLGCAWRFTIFL